MIDEKRLMMLKGIRACNSEYKQYDVISEQFDSAFIGKNIKKKVLERMHKKEQKQENNEFKRRQRILAKCKLCFHNEKVSSISQYLTNYHRYLKAN